MTARTAHEGLRSGQPGEDTPPPAAPVVDRAAALRPLITAIAAMVIDKLHGDESGTAPAACWRIAVATLVLTAPAVLDWAF